MDLAIADAGDGGEHHVKAIEKRPVFDEVKSHHADYHQSDQCHEQQLQIERDLHVSHSARWGHPCATTQLTSVPQSKTPSREEGLFLSSNFTSRNLPSLLDLVVAQPLHMAVVAPIAKVDGHPESQPDEQAHPC